MKLFWFEIRKVQNEPQPYKKGGNFYTWFWKLPVSNLDVLYSIYKKNTDCRRATSLIGKNVWLAWYYFAKGEDVIEPKEYQDILDYSNFRNLITSIVRDVLVSWNAYIVKLRNESWKLIWLETVDPRTIRVRATPTGEITGYEQNINGKVVYRYEASDVVNCFDESDPDNQLFWLSVLESLLYETLADQESAISNYYYFKNNAMPSRLLIAKEWASQTELETTVDSLRKNFAGWKNKHKIGIVQGIEKIEQIQDSMADMQFLALRTFTTERVCVAFDVPKIILWYTDGVNYSNHEWQYKKFIQNTITGRENNLSEWITEALELEWIEFHFRPLKFDMDNETIQAMEIKIRNWLITPNEARVEMWYEMIDVQEANELLVSKNYDRLQDIWLSMIPTNES